MKGEKDSSVNICIDCDKIYSEYEIKREIKRLEDNSGITLRIEDNNVWIKILKIN